MDEMLECANISLEILALDKANLPLGVSIFIFILLWLKVMVAIEVLKLKGNNIFANSLLDTTIQDGGTRKRSNNVPNPNLSYTIKR